MSYYMPAEFSRQRAAILVFPERPGSWGIDPLPAQKVFAELINTIAKHETVYAAVSPNCRSTAEKLLDRSENIRLLDIPTNDAWARDIARPL